MSSAGVRQTPVWACLRCSSPLMRPKIARNSIHFAPYTAGKAVPGCPRCARVGGGSHPYPRRGRKRSSSSRSRPRTADTTQGPRQPKPMSLCRSESRLTPCRRHLARNRAIPRAVGLGIGVRRARASFARCTRAASRSESIRSRSARSASSFALRASGSRAR